MLICQLKARYYLSFFLTGITEQISDVLKSKYSINLMEAYRYNTIPTTEFKSTWLEDKTHPDELNNIQILYSILYLKWLANYEHRMSNLHQNKLSLSPKENQQMTGVCICIYIYSIAAFIFFGYIFYIINRIKLFLIGNRNKSFKMWFV